MFGFEPSHTDEAWIYEGMLDAGNYRLTMTDEYGDGCQQDTGCVLKITLGNLPEVETLVLHNKWGGTDAPSENYNYKLQTYDFTMSTATTAAPTAAPTGSPASLRDVSDEGTESGVNVLKA